MAPRKPASLLNAARNGDQLKALTALRDRLAAEIDSCESKRDMAALSLRFMDIVEQIAELAGGGAPVVVKRTGLSEFEKRLGERESAAAAARRAAGG